VLANLSREQVGLQADDGNPSMACAWQFICTIQSTGILAILMAGTRISPGAAEVRPLGKPVKVWECNGYSRAGFHFVRRRSLRAEPNRQFCIFQKRRIAGSAIARRN
jgi:hypothetical protein